MLSNTLTANEQRDQRTVELLDRATRCTGAEADRLRAEAVEMNMPIAKSFAQRYANRGIPLDDLIQVADLGLVKAVIRFDPGQGSRFIDFMSPTVRGELRKHFRDAGWTVRPPRRIQELQSRIWRADEALTQRLHRSPRPSEVAEHLGVPLEEVREALAVDGCFTPASLDAPRTPDGRPAVELQASGSRDFASAEARMMLAPVVRELKERDRRILELRFFEGLTQQEIGEIVGVTQMQVSRLINRILRDLRRELDEVVHEPA